jgi:hypothetical protein
MRGNVRFESIASILRCPIQVRLLLEAAQERTFNYFAFGP